MTEYVFSFGLLIFFAIFVFWIIKFAEFPHSGNTVEIIIDGDTENENLEMLIRSAKTVSEKYLIGARIYIQGGDEKEVNILCRCYDIERKE